MARAPGIMSAYAAPLRDRVAVRLCNAIMRVLATEHYRKMIEGSVKYGLLAAARDEAAGAPPSPPESAYPPDATPLDPP